MATNYIQEGRVIDVVVAAAVTSGVPVAVGSMLGVPINDGAIGETVPHGVKGVWILPLKSGGSDLAIGTVVNFDAATGEVFGGAASSVSGDVNACGKVACNGALAADTHIEILLTPDTAEQVA